VLVGFLATEVGLVLAHGTNIARVAFGEADLTLKFACEERILGQ
jgi:hypothetical protein